MISTNSAPITTTTTAAPFASLEDFKWFIKDMFIKGSGIDPDLFDAAVEFHSDLEIGSGMDATAPIHDILGWHFTRFGKQCRDNLYAAILNNEDGSPWQVVVSIPNGKKRYSYLAPKGNGDKPYLPPIPQSIREKISNRYDVEVPLSGSFWDWVKQNPELPLAITEGGKKALSALSNGFIFLSLYGCNCGRELLPGDQALKPDLEAFVGEGRKWLLALDRDTKPNAKKAVSTAKYLLASAIQGYGNYVEDLVWKPAQGKGLDDYLVINGIKKFQFLYDNAIAKINEKSTGETLREKLSFCQILERSLYSEDEWICAANKLYKWEGNYYKQIPDGAEKRRIKEFCNSYSSTIYDKDSGELIKIYPYAKNAALNEGLDWIKNSKFVDLNCINPPGLNCLNGILQISWDGDMPSWSLIPHNPNYYYTYPPLVEYDPSADPKDCDRLLEALDAPQRDIFLKVIAASLDLPSVRRFKGRLIRSLLLRGTGSNGKDALREAIATIFGKQGVTSATLNDFAQYDDGRRFPLSSLIHSRINWASENTNSSKLDRIQSLKAAITGNPLIAECKGKDGQEFVPNSVFLFNINDVPNLQGSLEAILSRYGVLDFKKTYKTNADPAKGELEADPRFAYDSMFLRAAVCPALLNRLLDSLKDLMKNGINYDCTNEALEDIQAENSHLFAFMRDSGLGYMPNSCVSAAEIWQRLEQWYMDNGTLSYEENSSGKLKAIWADQPRFGDKNIKAINQVLARFKQLLPKAKLASVTHESGKRNIQVLEGVGFILNKENRIAISNFSTPVAHQFPHQESLTNQASHTTHTNFIYSKGENEKNVDILEAVTNLPDTVTESEEKTNLNQSLTNNHISPNSNIAGENIGVGGVETAPRADSGNLDCCASGVENSLIAMQNSLLRMEYQIGDKILCFPNEYYAGLNKSVRATITNVEYINGYLHYCEVAYLDKKGTEKTDIIGGGCPEYILKKLKK